jgi:hypothetical protein
LRALFRYRGNAPAECFRDAERNSRFGVTSFRHFPKLGFNEFSAAVFLHPFLGGFDGEWPDQFAVVLLFGGPKKVRTMPRLEERFLYRGIVRLPLPKQDGGLGVVRPAVDYPFAANFTSHCFPIT